MDDVDKLFPILWALNDALVIVDGKVEYRGSSNDVEEFKKMLTQLDPTFSRGLE